MCDKRKLIVVVGVSGAGKTVAMNFFENAGFYCIDNVPAYSFKPLLLSLENKTTEYDFAISINCVTSLRNIEKAISTIQNIENYETTILYLDASKETIIQRYKFTRKSHPLFNQTSSLDLAIAKEIEYLKAIKQVANTVIDTTMLNNKDLESKLQYLVEDSVIDQFKINFTSFGYKHGLPKDLDLAFDVRFIKNPYYLENLRPLTGNDEEVYNYVLSQPECQEFIAKMIPLFDFLFEQYEKEGKTYLVVGMGCTGGQHRSVTLANYFASYYKNKYRVLKDHRDAGKRK